MKVDKVLENKENVEKVLENKENVGKMDGHAVGHAVIQQMFMKNFNLPMEFISNDAITNTYFNYDKLRSMADVIERKVNNFKPKVAIVCGSGLGEIADLVQNKIIVPYTDIPEFPRSTTHGHKGNMIFGYLSDMPVVCMQGRFHPYEGYSVALCCIPIKIFKLMGVKLVILTNAAGGINTNYKLGDLMVLKDHISLPSFTLSHPLVGPNDERFGPRFLGLNNIYNKKIRELFIKCSKEISMNVHEGCYGSIGGPTYESPSDSRFCNNAGMDVVGMSTTHEAVVALYCGMKVLAFSIVTDLVSLEFDNEEVTDHKEIVKVANWKAKDAEKLVEFFLKKIQENENLIQ